MEPADLTHEDLTQVELPQKALTTAALLELQRRMLRIRYFEEAVQRAAKRAEIPGSVHLSIGQEAEIVGACAALLGPGGVVEDDIPIDLPRPRRLSDTTVATAQSEVLARLESLAASTP